MNLLLKLVVMATLLQNVTCKFGTLPDTCLDRKTKDSPSKDTEEYPLCTEYQDLSCCTVNKTRELHEEGTNSIKFIQTTCGNFSTNCLKYKKAASCWFHCEPMLYHFQHENWTHFPHEAPICGKYCDEWFDACKDDMTCVGDWREGFILDPDSRDCPADGSKCITYNQMYENGQGLCNTLYGNSLKYEASNKDCLLMMFDHDENPNLHGNPYGSASKASCSLIVFLVALWMVGHLL